jgi:hypothetical protein
VCEGRTQREGAQVLRFETCRAHQSEGVHLLKGFIKGHKASSREVHSTSGQRKKQRQSQGLAKRGGRTKAKGAFVLRLAGTSFEELHYKLEDKLGLYQVPCVFTCCSICFEISIYISYLSYWFSPWGFFQGHVDQKHLCTFVMVCLLLSLF